MTAARAMSGACRLRMHDVCRGYTDGYETYRCECRCHAADGRCRVTAVLAAVGRAVLRAVLVLACAAAALWAAYGPQAWRPAWAAVVPVVVAGAVLAWYALWPEGGDGRG